ncbi:sulfite exporter TauE/SafE family protein [Magnetospirillum molischianum]|uniref:Urease accessory protein UreH-like transmembrane domain-containing protein n=1 Tax=Magnetospirillum molischianum DSM 120 TaxID=1150626 RepID=H8FTL1_MAGML|nr:sulfite exporter TauE/SafE family protein [Magnetospirillum molischianum]CCG41699.1 conserved membrane hypothetical protein [Magnetospirillum molischianum DSM 120]
MHDGMHSAYEVLLAQCGSGSGLIATLLVTGLIGGVLHCGGMCGPLVLAQVMAGTQAVPAGPGGELRRLAGAALLPYHFGRVLTYTALGGIAGSIAGVWRDLPLFRWIAVALLLLAALLLALQAWPRRGGGAFGGFVPGLGRLVRPLFAAPIGWRGLLLGMILGLLPCGMVYAALAAAASAGDPLVSAVAMAAFGIGTMPVLILVAAIGHAALTYWRRPLLRIAPVLLLLNAGWLGLLAFRLAVG